MSGTWAFAPERLQDRWETDFRFAAETGYQIGE